MDVKFHVQREREREMDVKFHVLKYSSRRGHDLIPEDYKDYRLTTLAQARNHLAASVLKRACSLAGLKEGHGVRLKNGLLRLQGDGGLLLESAYRGGLKYKLLSEPNSGELELTKQDCLIALAYAAEHDDVDNEVEELVKCAGEEILSTRMPGSAALGTILHVCTEWASINTLEKVLTVYPKSVDVYILDKDGGTALHNLANVHAPKSYDDCKTAACLLLGHYGVNATKLLSMQNNYGRLTALCKALMEHQRDVCRALLDAGMEMEEKNPAMSSEAPHWLTLKAFDHQNTYTVFYTALHDAILQEYDDIVAKILAYPGAQGLNLTSLQDYQDNTPLHIAAEVQNPEICSMLLKYSMEFSKDGGSIVRSQNKAGQTPLHLASTHGHTAVCGKLLEFGAPVELPDKHGKYALTNAFANSHNQVVKKLLDACLPTAQDAFTPAKSEPSFINTRSKHSLINEQFEFGLTPLHVAVAISSKLHISNLLKAGAWVNSMDDDGRTPLHVVTQQYDPNAFMQLLRDTKMKNWKSWIGWINTRDNSGQTALHNIVRLSRHSAKDQSESISEEESKSREQESSAMKITDEGNQNSDTESETSSKEESSDHEMEITEEEEKSEFSIDVVCMMVEELLNKGAWVDVQDCDGETVLHEAARRHEKIVWTLLSKTTLDSNFRSSINSKDKWIAMCDFSGETALHGAARTGHLDIVQRLLKQTQSRGDLLRVRDMENMTALDWAAQNQNNETMIDEMMNGLESTDHINITKDFLMWNLKEHINPRAHERLCKKYRVNGNQASLLKAAVRMKDVDIARELINRGADVPSLEYNDRRWLAQNFGKKASDQPTLEDTLGRKALVQGVATLLLNPYTETPITIGIFGSWGTGKSSFMLQVEEAMLYMAVKETFKKTPYTRSHDKEPSVLKFSRMGTTIRCMVVKALKQRMIRADKYNQGNQSTCRKAVLAMTIKPPKRSLPSADIENQGNKSTCGTADIENQLILKDGSKSASGSADTENQITSKEEDDTINQGYQTTYGSGSADIKNQRTLKEEDEVIHYGNQSTYGIADSENQMTDEDDIINCFPMELQPKYHQLFRDLALTDRSKLVQSHTGAWYPKKVGIDDQTLQDAHLTGYTPAVLTLHYNAWQYDNKIEASAGLAVEISHQLESFMAPHQWLRMCWKHSWNRQPREICVQLLLPFFLALVVVCVVPILWKFVPVATKLKALCLPMGIVGVMWAFFKTSLKVIQPVTQSMLNNPKSIDHQSMLGYQHQVINEIKFLKDQLCNDAHVGWKIVSFLCQLFISNNYFMEGTWIWKQHPRLNNFRMVIFIDDLDRCDEKTILELLRATNLILGSCGISAVIGVDKGMVQRAITKEFLKDIDDKVIDMSMVEKSPEVVGNVEKKKTQEEKDSQILESNKKMGNDDKHSYTRELADKYLQKIIQLPIEMPEPSRKHIEHFLEGQVGKLPKEKVEDAKTKVHKDEKKEIKRKSNEDDVEEKHVTNEGDAQSEEGIESGRGDLIVFHLVLANYTPMEKDMLKELCQFTTKERGFPREWKRFLNYHRLAWTILSQDKNMKNKEFKGWQRKLILWIFICWNWRDQMDVIFENWNDIISKSSKLQAHGINLELSDIIHTYMKSMGWRQGGEIAPKSWMKLYHIVKDEYDIPMDFIEKFQQFRFYCKLNHLEIDKQYKPKKKSLLESRTYRKSTLTVGH